jgi:predicted phage terminase large subunit-like protein
MMTSDNDTGYRRPPKGSQFKPGVSGNPRGRRKGSRNLRTDLSDLLKKNITVRVNGRARRITRQETILLAQFDRAVKGDTSAALGLIKTVMKYELSEQQELAQEVLSPADEAIVNNFLRRRRAPVPAAVKATRQEFYAILRTDLLAFTYKCFAELNPGKTLSMNWHHEAICFHLQFVLDGDIRRLLFNLPPRSLKSLFCSIALPAYLLGKDSTHQIICISYSQELAASLAADFRKIVQSDWYREAFDVKEPVKDTETEYKTPSGGHRLAISVGGSLTGHGGNLIIIDDPLNAEDALSDAARKRVNAWFGSSLLSRLNNKQRDAIILVMQRLHLEDLSGFLLEQGGWLDVILPALAPKTMRVDLDQYRYHDWNEGEPLHPKRESRDALDELKRNMGSAAFNSQYLQQPVPLTGYRLNRNWLKYIDVLPVRQAGDEIIQSWDTAMKVTNTAAFSVCLTFLVRDNTEFYLIGIFRERLEFPDLVKAVLRQHQKHRPNAVLIEEQASGIPLVQEVRKRGLNNVIPVQPHADKLTRMMGRTSMLEGGSLILVRSIAGLDDFVAEFLAFDIGKYKDQIDALSQFLDYCARRSKPIFEYEFV